MLDQLISPRSSDLYQRLIAGEYHVLSQINGSPPDMDDCEQELIDNGFARVRVGDPALLVPVAPAVAAQQVLRRLSDQMMTWQQSAAQSVEQLIRMHDDSIQLVGGSADRLAQVITVPAEILAIVDDIQVSAAEELLSLDLSTAAGSLCIPRVSPAAVNPPPCWRTVFSTDFLTAELHEIPRRTRQAGGQVRTAATLPMKLLIADRAQALVPLDHTGSVGVVLIRSPTIIGALVELFETVWARALAYLDDRPQEGDLSPYEQHVVGLLAAGLKDEEIAALTRVSVRTVRRHISSVMEKTSATTRFAAGVQAARHGWI
jgi:DNA-binding CsgD family transcriptional regulator